jgi:hypothetical protein
LQLTKKKEIHLPDKRKSFKKWLKSNLRPTD